MDRLEREEQAFFERTAAIYEELAASEPDRVRPLDATLPPVELVAAALAELADLL